MIAVSHNMVSVFSETKAKLKGHKKVREVEMGKKCFQCTDARWFSILPVLACSENLHQIIEATGW